MKRLAQDLVVTAFGVVTSIATALLLFVVEQSFSVSLYTWTVWFVIPVGAMLAGFVAASGYYAGARLFGHRPTPLILTEHDLGVRWYLLPSLLSQLRLCRG